VKTILINLSVVLLTTMSGLAEGTTAQSADAKTPPPPPRSFFTQPTNQREGRDPFWPESTRVWDSNIAVKSAAETATTLKVDGYSIVGGRPIVIINKVSFLNGDEADLPAPGGGHTHVHCISIESDHVEVEVNGMRRDIRY
jgi:hypothetical protein